MSPQDLIEYLIVLRENNVASAHLIIESNHINVVFNPEPLPVDNKITEPGGWKSPPNLDSGRLFENSEHEV